MNSIDYDVDPLGGLMPQILALTAPPGTRDNIRQPCQQQNSTNASCPVSTNGNGQSKTGEAGLAAHPYFRRPGRGHNHDCCDACSEGGDLICCDLCPASFHLTCHDPPLDEDEIPTGEWACHQCRMGAREEESKPTCVNGKSIKGGRPSKKKEDAKHKAAKDRKVFAGGRELHISDTPLYTLIKAAAVVNPTQFTLPYEMTLPANFPGEPKETMYKKNGSRRGFPKKKPYELDNGLVPLPAKLCYQCNKSCRMGPLIPCDFCPLFYHLDCLDPPLTTPPMGRWMCPNHPEHLMDTTLLRSHSLTERVKLWDRFSTPVDQDSVKLNFFQRCHRMNPPFRFKVKKALRSRLRVPSAIKAHYNDPPDLLPHLSPSQYLPFPAPFDSYPLPAPETTQCRVSVTTKSTMAQGADDSPTPITPGTTTGAEKSPPEVKEEEESVSMEVDSTEWRKKNDELPPEGYTDALKPTQEEKDEWLASLLSLQSSIIRHMGTGSTDFSNTMKNCESKKDPCNGITHSDEALLDSRPNFLNGDLVSHEGKTHKMCLDGMNNHITNSGVLPHSQSSVCTPANKRISHKSPKNKLSSSKSRQKRSSQTEMLADTLDALGERLKKKLEENHDITLNSLDESVVVVLAYQRLKEILEPPKPEVVLSTPPIVARALLCPLVPDYRLKDFSPKQKYSSTPVPMTFRILNIGKGSHNHVNLELYGHCNYISHHHACILFDETTGHYELLNYSEYDTKVDGVVYNCDYTEKTVSQAVPPPFLQHVKAIIARRRGDQSVMITSPPPAMSTKPGVDFVRCECHKEEKHTKGSGWEGTAVLHHGSYIRFGCVKFVFSVVEEASKGDWSRDTTTTYEKFFREAEEEREKEEETDKDRETKEKEKKGKKEDKSVKS